MHKRTHALAAVDAGTGQIRGSQGITAAEYPIWFGLFVPARTPREVIEKLNRETLKALQEPKLRERLSNLGVDPMAMSPAQFEAHVQREIALNTTLVKAVGIKPE